jgi:hypothetical protein
MANLPEYPVLSQLAAWGNFYVIVGSSAGALTGLQFVVMALISETKTEGSMAEIRAFGTPTIVHFCAVLLASALMSAPWVTFSSAAILLGIFGAAGTTYALMILHRARRQNGYKPVLEDWLWHCAFPLVSYLCFVAAAILLQTVPRHALFILAAAEVFLLFIGIHNAWDTVTYIVVEKGSARRTQQP